MPGNQLEEIMVRFVRREIDVLVCTMIIESGLDIPNANTIVITQSDRLGLAEIYQLRGRVGREQAYAYLLIPSLDGLSKDAQQRLRALMDYNELGGGFKLAGHERSADPGRRQYPGHLAERQHCRAVGYDLYLDRLQKTVLDLKRKGSQEPEENRSLEVDPGIHLKVSAYIPERFISDRG